MLLLTLAAALAADPPQLAATFYPWYEWRDGALVSPDPRPLRQQPLAAATCDPTAVAWLAAELDAVAAAGIDTLLVANVPAPARLEATLRALGHALADRAVAGAPPVAIGLLLEPHFAAQELAGGAGAPAVPPLDLRDAAVRASFLAPLDHFFAEIAAPFRATFRGGPLVLVGGDGAVAACPPDFFDVLESEAPGRFGALPTLVIDPSWNLATRPQWRRGAALFGPQRRGTIASLGPGWLDAETGRGMIRPPAGRAEFLGEAQRLLAEAPPELLIVESWNQFHDGSAVAPTLEHGTRYTGALRRIARALREPGRAATWETAPPREPLLATSWHPGRQAVLANAIDWRADGEGSGLALVATSAAAGSTFELPPAARRATAAEHELRIEATGAGEWQVRVGGAAETVAAATDARGHATLRLPAWSTLQAPRLHLATSSSAELVRVTVTRSGDRLPEGGLGIDDPALFASALPATPAARAAALRRVAAAAALGARWLRFELDVELLPAAAGGAIDWSVARDLVATIRDHGLEPLAALVSLPKGAPPLGADPDAVATLVADLRAACGEGLRVVELFPEANRPRRFAPAPDLPGYLRALRAVAARLHRDAPDLALIGGGIAGPDVEWCEAWRALREPWHLDASALRLDDRYGAAGGPTAARALTRMVPLAAARPGLPGLLTLAPTVRATTREQAERDARVVATAGALVGEALRRCELTGAAIHLLDAPDLPPVGGFTPAHARAVLAAAGGAVVTQELVALLGAIGDGRAKVVAIATGEWWPAELMAALPGFLDRGGLLLALGGPPALRSALLADGPGFELGSAEFGLALHDDLRISHLPWERSQSPLPATARLVAGRTFPAFAPATEPLPIAALFRRRTGEPRDPRGYHRYDELLSLQDGADRTLADVAVLLHYQGGREGALLLLGLDGEAGLADAAAQAAALAEQLAQVAALPAEARRIVLWRGLTDAADSAHGLLDAAFDEKPAAQLFRQAAGK